MADKNKQKRLKRQFISLEDKIKILNRIKDGQKMSLIAKSLNLRLTTIRTIKENEDKIRKSVAEGCSISAKRVGRVRDINIIKMENALMTWFQDCVNNDIPMSEYVIKQKALEIYQHMKETGNSSAEQPNASFHASNGWLQSLKKRFFFRNIKLQKEQASVDVPPVEEQYANIAVHSAFQLNVEDLIVRDINADDVNELFTHQSLTEGELIQLSEQHSNLDLSNTSIDSNIENKSSSNINLNGIEKIIDSVKQLQLDILENDPSIVRSRKSRRELQGVLLRYEKLLVDEKRKKGGRLLPGCSDKTSVPTTNLITLNENITRTDKTLRPLKKRILQQWST